jgi:hypothetical protein
MRKVRIGLAWILFSWMWLGCAEEPPPRLTGYHLQKVDTLYRAGIDSLAPILDSTCAAQHDDRLQQIVDSLIRIRKAEEQKMRERLLVRPDEE